MIKTKSILPTISENSDSLLREREFSRESEFRLEDVRVLVVRTWECRFLDVKVVGDGTDPVTNKSLKLPLPVTLCLSVSDPRLLNRKIPELVRRSAWFFPEPGAIFYWGHLC